MKTFCLFCVWSSVIGSVLIGDTDAAVTGWSSPSIPSKSGSGTFTIDETSDTAITIGSVACGSDNTNSLEIISQPASVKFVLDSGDLKIASGSLDYEAAASHVLKVLCKDDVDLDVGTATITVIVLDVSEPPEFPQTQYSVAIADGSTEGTALITVSATDPEGYTVDFSLDNTGNEDGHWTLDGDTIRVAANVTLDQATRGGYRLQIVAKDIILQSATATIWVAVKTC